MEDNSKSLIKLRKRLEKVEEELDKSRTSSLQDGWQTQKHSKKSRKWDVLAAEKRELKDKIEELENPKIG